MPKTITVGDVGPEVSLLQVRLNALTPALPPLVVDGEFGPITEQRIREFQSPVTRRAGSGSGAVPWALDTIVAIPGGIRHDPEGQASDERVAIIVWKDSRYADRLLTLGSYLHQYDFSFFDNQVVVKRSANDKADGHPGFGYVVSHSKSGNSPLGKRNPPNRVETLVYSGGHHALHRIHLDYDRDKEGGGEGIAIPLVIQWFVATGRDHPVWSVTWDPANARNPRHISFDAYCMDVRGPYGSLNFDGAPDAASGEAISGVAWGDCRFAFTTTGATLNLDSAWTYDTPNSVNFVRAWTDRCNAEMGIVQTRPLDRELGYPDRVEGNERGTTSANTGLPDCGFWGDDRNYAMPCVYGWPYQLMNYDWDPAGGKLPTDSTRTKLMGWGSPYGWLGSSGFKHFDASKLADGRGERSYATFIVLGPKNRYDWASSSWDAPGDVSSTIASVEALAAASIVSVTAGALVTAAPKGPGATEMKPIVNGYDDTYAAFRLAAANNEVRFTFTPATGKPIDTPIFIIENYTASSLPHILVGGRPFTVNDGAASLAFVSINEAGNELWVTLRAILSQATSVQILQSRW